MKRGGTKNIPSTNEEIKVPLLAKEGLARLSCKSRVLGIAGRGRYVIIAIN